MQFVFGKKNIPSIPELGNLPNIAATYESTKEDRSKTKQTQKSLEENNIV